MLDVDEDVQQVRLSLIVLCWLAFFKTYEAPDSKAETCFLLLHGIELVRGLRTVEE